MGADGRTRPFRAGGRILYVLLACCAGSGAGAAVLAVAGCASPRAGPAGLTAAAGPTVRTITADWPDVRAAMEIAVRKAELAIIDREVGEADRDFIGLVDSHAIATSKFGQLTNRLRNVVTNDDEFKFTILDGGKC